MPNSNKQPIKKTSKIKKTSVKTSKTKKTPSSKSLGTSKKEPQTKSGFKKSKIPVKVINTPFLEESERLQPVPETTPDPVNLEEKTLTKKEKRNKKKKLTRKKKARATINH